jgi:filamentous hemagglutinin family protein
MMVETSSVDQTLQSKAKFFAIGTVLLGASALVPFAIDPAFAMDPSTLPSGGVVNGGQATFDYSTPNQLHVNQQSDRAIIDWQSFNIGSEALTRFHQPSSSSMAVNRISGTSLDPTVILGTLKANGQVIVLDQNGVIFGQGSKIDVGGIIASTGKVDAQAVMRGDQVLHLSDIKGGAIVNEGTMSVSDAGIAALVAPSVRNNGVIQAKLGKVVLASGTSATIDLYGDGLIEVGVDSSLTETLVENNGTINANGGKIVLTAAAAKGIVNSVVNNTGLINASSAKKVGGKVVLSGGTVSVDGTINASGKTGGGEILIGGDKQGKGSVKTASKTTVAKTAKIDASATGEHGNGGKVIVWSDDETVVSGDIKAKGGSVSGDGGFVETSSKNKLIVEKDISINAAAGNDQGKAGEWLIDPQNIVISDTGTAGDAADSKIASSTINTMLDAGTDVTIATTSPGVGAGDIVIVNANILKSIGNNNVTLTLNADRDIVIGASSITNTTGGVLNLILNSDKDANQLGGIYMKNATINTGGGYVVMGGGAGDYGAAGGPDTTAAYATNRAADAYTDYMAYIHGINLQSSNIQTGGGNITMNGQASAAGTDAGVYIYSTTLKTTSGNINITGTSGAGYSTLGGAGVDSNSLVETVDGDIYIKGVTTSNGGAGSTINTAVGIGGGSIIRTTTNDAGKGNITIDGDASGSNADIRRGLDLGSSYTTTPTYITTQRGNITLLAKQKPGEWGQAMMLAWRGLDIGSQNGGNVTLNAHGGDINIASLANESWYFRIGHENTANTEILAGNISVTSDQPTLSGFFGKNVIFKPSTSTGSINIGSSWADIQLTANTLSFVKAGEKLIIGDSVNGKGDISVHGWNLAGTTYDVELHGNDITIADPNSAGYGVTLGSGNFTVNARDNAADLADINVNASIVKSAAGASTLNLRAERDILINAASISTTGGLLNTILNSDRNANQNGAIYISGGTVNTNGGYLVLGGGSGTVGGADGILGNGDGGGADDVAAYGNASRANGVFIGTNSNINTAGGNFIANGVGSNLAANGAGVRVNGTSQINTGAGFIKLTGTGANGAGNNTGVSIENSSVLDSSTGGITLIGTGGAATAGTNNQGVGILSGSIIRSSGTGPTAAKIYIEGKSGGATAANQSLNFTGGSFITTTDGDIEIYGKSSNGISSITSNQAFTVESKGAGNILIKVDDTGSNNNTITFSNTGVQTIGHADMTGDITIVTKALTSYDANDRILTKGAVKIMAPDAARNIIVGGAGAVADLVLSDALLGTITAGKLVIGDALTTVGNITVDSWDLVGKLFNTELHGTIINTIGAYGIQNAVGNILMSAKDKVDIDSNITTTGTLTISGVNGITIADADLKANGITAQQAIVYDGAGNNNRKIDAGTGTLNLQSVNAATNNLNIVADDLTLNGNITVDVANTLTLQTSTAGRVINLGSGTGGLDIDSAEMNRISAGTIVIGDSASYSNNIAVDAISLAGKAANLVAYANNVTINALTSGDGNFTFYSKGPNGITVTGVNTSNGAGQFALLTSGALAIDGSIINTGSGKIGAFAGWDGTSALTTPSSLSFDSVRLAAAAKDIVLGATGYVSSNAADTSVLLVSSGNFKNNSALGASALSAANGRYLVYGTAPADTVKGGLSAVNLYNKAYDTSLPATITGASRFVYSAQPTLTLKVNDLTWPNTTTAAYTYGSTGLVTGDILADAISGTATYNYVDNGDGTYTVSIDAASVNSPMGYNVSLQSGTLTIGAAPATLPPASPNDGSVKIENIIHYSSNIPTNLYEADSDNAVITADAELESEQAKVADELGCLVTDGISGGCLSN